MTLVDADFERDASLGQWWTDPRLARAVVDWARIPAGARVCEPGAGVGRFVDALLERGHAVDAIEVDPRLVAHLRERYAGVPSVSVVEADYLELGGARARLAIGNPTFQANNEGAFMLHGARLCGRAVMILRLHALASASRWDAHWSRLRITRAAVCVPRPPFHGSGMHEICVVEAVPRRTRRRPGETDRIEFGELRWK